MRKHVPLTVLAVIAASLTVPAAASAADRSDTVTPLPAGDHRDIVVDDARERIFLASADPAAVVIAGFDGGIITTVTGLTSPVDLELAPGGTAVYALDGGTLARIDTTSFAVDHVTLPASHCADSLAVTGGKVWYSYHQCDAPGEGSIASFEPGTGKVTESGLTTRPGRLLARADRPDRLVRLDEAGADVFDVSGAAAQKKVSNAEPGCGDATLLRRGDLVLTACGGDTSRFQVWATSDLLSRGSTYLGEETAVAASADGRFAAFGFARYPGEFAVHVRDLGADLSGAYVRRFELPTDAAVTPGSLAFTGDGRLIIVPTASDGTRSLRVYADPFTPDAGLTATGPRRVLPGTPITITGKVTPAPGRPALLSLSRTRNDLTEFLPGVSTDADGNYSFTDDPQGFTGRLLYEVTAYNADGFGEVKRSVPVVAQVRAFDFNADGFPETVTGAPGEDTGSSKDTGQITVFPGGANGPDLTAGKIFDQDTPGVSGSNETGDRFGTALASGDFNGDGYADLAVGSPTEDNDSFTDSGAIIVLYGSSSGLSTESNMFASGARTGYHLGQSLVALDLDGDGMDELAAGAPGWDSGAVLVYERRHASRLLDTWAFLDQEYMTGVNHTGEGFGWSLATGDIDGDGLADLAIGAPQDTDDKGWSTGSVSVLYGSRSGVNSLGAQRITKETPGVPGSAGPRNAATGDGADEFGLKLAMGDFNGDGRDDLAAAAPGTHVKNAAGTDQPDAGSVTVLYSDGAKLGTTGATEITQLSGPVFGAPADNDFFGDTLAAGDANGDGTDELAMFSYGDDRLWVTPGSTAGLLLATTTAWNQDTPGIPGSAESGDKWGSSLRFLAGTKPALLVGAPGEDAQQGAFTVVFGGPSGLTGTGAIYVGEDTPGVPGTAENGDRFGTF
ncbi:hypothetical protein Afil01_19000 [Actinorhabdospora filicis]|uniref:FG-GAP repeat protein n=1 Tax=Actinorhabdospora filicis TaxID=1785913 RepID=A0A9W6W8L3_9ACTN|nr:FG-GAP-like repeat-containing protein [Actinorhabdospora filicis]GLZ77093.1 hypothetical protein Afil01_19000 [Actinorhabdospora filicis]